MVGGATVKLWGGKLGDGAVYRHPDSSNAHNGGAGGGTLVQRAVVRWVPSDYLQSVFICGERR